MVSLRGVEQCARSRRNLHAPSGARAARTRPRGAVRAQAAIHQHDSRSRGAMRLMQMPGRQPAQTGHDLRVRCKVRAAPPALHSNTAVAALAASMPGAMAGSVQRAGWDRPRAAPAASAFIVIQRRPRGARYRLHLLGRHRRKPLQAAPGRTDRETGGRIQRHPCQMPLRLHDGAQSLPLAQSAYHDAAIGAGMTNLAPVGFRIRQRDTSDSTNRCLAMGHYFVDLPRYIFRCSDFRTGLLPGSCSDFRTGSSGRCRPSFCIFSQSVVRPTAEKLRRRAHAPRAAVERVLDLRAFGLVARFGQGGKGGHPAAAFASGKQIGGHDHLALGQRHGLRQPRANLAPVAAPVMAQDQRLGLRRDTFQRLSPGAGSCRRTCAPSSIAHPRASREEAGWSASAG
jgi:hypothetical protein